LIPEQAVTPYKCQCRYAPRDGDVHCSSCGALYRQNY